MIHKISCAYFSEQRYTKNFLVLFLLPLFLLANSPVHAQDPRELFETAKKALVDGKPDDCLNYLKQAQEALGGSNARIESIKCQALVQKSDWIGAGIAYKNFDMLIPSASRTGEAYTYMQSLKKTIWDELEYMRKKKLEEVEKEKKEDLKRAIAEEARQEKESAQKLAQLKQQAEERFYNKAMATKDRFLLSKFISETDPGSAHFKQVQEEMDKIKHPGNYIIQAVQNNDVKETMYLIRLGADKNTHNTAGESLLHIAIQKKYTDIFDSLLRIGVNIEYQNKKDETPLLKAVKSNFDHAVQMLLAKKANPNVRDVVGNNALTICLLESYTNYIRPLKESGVDLDQTIEFEGVSQTPLYYTVYTRNDLKMASELLKNGADVNAYSNTNWTPLMAATYKNNESMMELLLANKADVNKAGPHYWTALHFAVRTRNAESIRLLIKNGANKKATDQWKRTPITIARERRYTDILKVFTTI